MNNHTHARIGKRMFIVLHDGRHFTDKVIDAKDRYLCFEKMGRIWTDQIRSLSIMRRPPVPFSYV